MDRRHFIHLSASSLGSLLFPFSFDGFPAVGALSASASGGRQAIALPAGVSVRTDAGLQEMAGGGGGETWTFRDVIVTLRESPAGLGISLRAPHSAIHQLVFLWTYPVGKKELVLGDHWERSYGDLGFRPAGFGAKMPWYFIQTDGQSTTCFGLKTGCNTIGHWNVGDDKMQLTLDTQSGGVGVQLGSRELLCAEMIGTHGTPGESVYDTGRRFCKRLCDGPRLPKKPVYGINDWYYAYGNNSAKLILEQTTLFSDLITDTDNQPFSVVDAGWASYSPLLPGDCCWQDDFSRPNDKFRDMHSLAMDIGKLGMRPGLWTRPLSAAHDIPRSRLLPSIPGRDDPKRPILDPTIPENIGHIKKNIELYRQWGFHLVKHDYSTFDLFGRWGFEMSADLTPPGWRLYDIGRTNAEVIKDLYQSIRAAAGDMYLLGCNTMSHLSAGLFEIDRIGDDTSGKEWDRTRKMGVNTLGFRLLHNDSFYAADGDCVGLTSEIPWAKNRQWMQLLAGSGTPLFISAQPDVLGKEQRDYIRKSFATAARKLPVAEPLDWLEHQRPQQWRLDGTVVNFDWS